MCRCKEQENAPKHAVHLVTGEVGTPVRRPTELDTPSSTLFDDDGLLRCLGKRSLAKNLVV